MIEVSNIRIYPVTGCAGIDQESAMVEPGGLVNDRRFVLHGPDNTRVSQKEFPALAQVKPVLVADGLLLTHPKQSDVFVPFNEEDPRNQDNIVEFGDTVTCYHSGMEAARFLSNVAGYPVILVEKSQSWRLGEYINPADRTNQPVHIINEDSVESLQAKAPDMHFESNRFRGNLMVRGAGEFEENSWLGRSLRLPLSAFAVIRRTPRCKVPGHNPETGEDLKDVPTLYRN